MSQLAELLTERNQLQQVLSDILRILQPPDLDVERGEVHYTELPALVAEVVAERDTLRSSLARVGALAMNQFDSGAAQVDPSKLFQDVLAERETFRRGRNMLAKANREWVQRCADAEAERDENERLMVAFRRQAWEAKDELAILRGLVRQYQETKAVLEAALDDDSHGSVEELVNAWKPTEEALNTFDVGGKVDSE